MLIKLLGYTLKMPNIILLPYSSHWVLLLLLLLLYFGEEWVGGAHLIYFDTGVSLCCLNWSPTLDWRHSLASVTKLLGSQLWAVGARFIWHIFILRTFKIITYFWACQSCLLYSYFLRVKTFSPERRWRVIKHRLLWKLKSHSLPQGRARPLGQTEW